MNRGFQRLLSLVLCAIMVCGILPAVPAHAEETTPIKLGTPTDLRWGVDGYASYDEEGNPHMTESPLPGSISWKVNLPDQGDTIIKIYNEKHEEVDNHYWCFDSISREEYRYIDGFCNSDPESGTYYFTVQAAADGNNYENSDIATSDTWTYVKPDAKLPSATNLTWNWPEFNWDAVDNEYLDGYVIQVLFAITLDEDPHVLSTSWYRYPSTGSSISDYTIMEGGVGYYFFKIRGLSSDITKCCNGEWSELSEPYNLAELVLSNNAELENMLTNSENMTAEEIRAGVQDLNMEDLKTSMLADDQTIGMVSALEELVGGPAPVEVSEAVSSFDASKVSIVGANLNNSASETDPIKLVLDKPAKEDVIPEAYNNSVAVRFSMTLDNVADPENLEVPVKINIPIPSNINPDFLVILHYHANGDMEELWPYIYEENGQYFASFVLTSFSDFVMTEAYLNSEFYAGRVYGENRFTTSFMVADFVKAVTEQKKLRTIIVASGANFADALSGSYLANKKVAPILLSYKDKQNKDVLAYIEKNLAQDGIVYILGGNVAVPESFENMLIEKGIKYKRLAGANRYETNLEILKEAGVDSGSEILVCTGKDFADCLSASATGRPILMVHTKMTDAQTKYLGTLKNSNFCIIGGENAVSKAVADKIAGFGKVERLAGAHRYETSVKVAERYFDHPDYVFLAYARNYPDGLCGGVLSGMVAAPLLLTDSKYYSFAQQYVQETCEGSVSEGYTLGGPSLISDAAIRAIFNMSVDQDINVISLD